MGKRNREWKERTFENTDSYIQYFDMLTELSIAMFEWKNLPDTVDPRFLEMTLFERGSCIFFEDKDLGFLALPCATMGRLNVYGIPTIRDAYASNGYRNKLNANNSEIIFNNMIHKNSIAKVRAFARRLSNIDRTIDVNVNAQKTPILIRGEEGEMLTLRNLYAQWTGNEPVIWGFKSLHADDAFSVLKTDAPYVSNHLYELKTMIWNEALTYLGITNINVTKRERMITDEVTRNQGGTVASRYSRLNERREACDRINKKFGLNISCDYREDFQNITDIANDTLNEGGGDNE